MTNNQGATIKLTENLARAVVCNNKIQVAVINATNIVNESIQQHKMLPVAAAALGRGLMASVFLGLNLKNEDSITFRVLGDGPLGGMITQADAQHRIRGYVANPDLDLPLNAANQLDVGGAVGREGCLYVTKDMGLKEPYTGSSELVSGEIAEDLANYFFQSEQSPVVVSMGVIIDVDRSCVAAGGFMIRAMPGADETDLIELEEWLKVLPPISSLVMQLTDPQEILQALFPKEELVGVTKEGWHLQCNCNRERLERLLLSMGTDEIKDMLVQDGQAELRCHFCSKTYLFDADDLIKLIQEIQADEAEA